MTTSSSKTPSNRSAISSRPGKDRPPPEGFQCRGALVVTQPCAEQLASGCLIRFLFGRNPRLRARLYTKPPHYCEFRRPPMRARRPIERQLSDSATSTQSSLHLSLRAALCMQISKKL